MNSNLFRSPFARLSAGALASVIAIAASNLASAQAADIVEADPAAPVIETSSDDSIIVTASRVNRAGFDAPTPTTVVGEAELRQGARPNIAAVLNDLPAFRPTLNPGNTSLSTIKSGVQAADLRGLGETRTLVLMNGHRFVGDNDLNTVPNDLVQRVEVVTGGASADWGSGAIAGVVNIILDDDYTGVKLSGRVGISSRGDGFEYRLSAAAGQPFADGRGHVLFNAEYYDSKGITPATSRPRIGDATLLGTTLVTDVSATNLSEGGLILSGVLSGRTFNADRTTRPFDFGTSVGASLSRGGEQSAGQAYQYLTPPISRYNLFGRVTFDVNDNVTLFGDMRFMRTDASYLFSPDRSAGDITISIENAFLPAAVRTAMSDAGQTSFRFGRNNDDFAFRRYEYSREDIQGVVGAKGSFGEGWNWDSYYTHGVRTIQQEVFNARIKTNFANATDSVNGVNGQPVCRINVDANPNNNDASCVPIDLFGFGAPSQAAADYVNGEAFLRYRQKLDVAAATLRGDPFSLWAGPVSVVVGAEWRKESIRTLGNDPISLANGFTTINSKGYDGSFSAKEAFGGIVIPLLKDVPLFRQLEFSGSVRVSDYSNTGTIWAWKLGLTNQLFDGLRVRFVRSRDTRSASLIELFTKQTSSTSTVTDTFFTPATQYQATAFGGGNPGLKPEQSDTTSFGLVFTPDFARGLSLSVDYYDIDIDNAIATLTAQDIITRCYNGSNAGLCSLITRDAANGNRISSIQSTFINLANYKTRGLDFEGSYVLPLERVAEKGSGNLRFRVLANYVDKLTTNDGVRRADALGVVGPGQTFGVPRWRGVGSISYEWKDSSIDLRARYMGPGTYNPALAITNNHVPSQTYVDLSFDLGVPFGADNSFALFGSVSNLFDKAPPIAANPQFYDIVGRYMTIGARVKF